MVTERLQKYWIYGKNGFVDVSGTSGKVLVHKERYVYWNNNLGDWISWDLQLNETIENEVYAVTGGRGQEI